MEQIETNTKYLFDCVADFENTLDNKKSSTYKERLGKIICRDKLFNPQITNVNGNTILGAILNKILNYNVQDYVLTFVLQLIQTNMFDLTHINKNNKSIFDIVFQIVISKLNPNIIDKIIAKILSIDKKNLKMMSEIAKTFEFDNGSFNSSLLMFLIKYKLKRSVEKILEHPDYDLTYQNSQGYTILMYAIEHNIGYLVEAILNLSKDKDIGINLINNNQDSALLIACRKEQEPIHYIIRKMIKINGLRPDLLNKKGFNAFTEYVTTKLYKCDFCCLDDRICYNLFKFCLGYNYDYSKPIYVQELNKTFPNMLYFLLGVESAFTQAFICEFIKLVDIEIDYKFLELAAKEHCCICMGDLLGSGKLEDMDKYANKKEIFENIFALACHNTDIVSYSAEQTSINILSYSTNFDKRKSLLQLHHSIIVNNIDKGPITQFLSNEYWLRELALYDKGIFEIDLNFAYEHAEKNKLERVCKFILNM